MAHEVEVVDQLGKLCVYRLSLREIFQDYVISFEDEVMTCEDVLDKTYDLFQQLMDKFKDKKVKARLIAKVK